MKVLLLISRPQRRGAEVFALALAEALVERGHESRVLTLYGPSEQAAPLALRPGDVALDGRADHPAERLPGFQPDLLRRLLAEVDRFAPDIVQVNGSRTVKYGSLLRRRRRRAPWALVYRSIGTPTDWLRGPLHRALYRRLVVSQVDGVVAVSQATLASLRAAYGEELPATVIPRGVALADCQPEESRQTVRRRLGTPDATPVLVFLGSLSPEKRLDRLLRVAEEVRRRLPTESAPPELWIVGGGPQAASVAAAAADAPLVVRLLGAVERPASLLAAADLLLLTSDTEGTPGAILEAAAVGVPAVATRVGGVAELVLENETGLTLPASDEAAMAVAAAALLADPARRQAMGEAARRHVGAHFALPAVTSRLLDFYGEVLSRRTERHDG